ncbi:MBL fold metallo-hydrolase [Nitrospirillum pindoramense]|uniref:Ribonuclease BN (tRNA processing enzyme) n=1 Tax=Nitrospirillum amazonense TaxID=28077 RepID=A0A560GVQ3_9PROT|nr:MBL fold metallo-hydrolase [Nitrospirillum amazonense]TWB38105.1 ribonuclease BN (tRNA processing enzyme) [Nitrospirillum amazonense]
MTRSLPLFSLVAALALAAGPSLAAPPAGSPAQPAQASAAAQAPAAEAPVTCKSGIALQLLGSGGPISDDGRASSGAVIWIDGKARLLIDAGGGTYLRYGQSGARLEDLDFIGISHFHTDHVADLPAILKGAYFLSGNHEVQLVGPSGDANFPSMTTFFDREFGRGHGAFEYLSGLSNASDGLQLAVHPSDVNVASPGATRVWQGDGVTVYAFGIPHGDVPALAFRIETPQGVIVLSADQNGSRKEFVDFARGADILMMPAAIDDDADAQSRFLHATPTIVGKIAAAVNPKMLVLDHFMGRSLRDKDKNVGVIRQFYTGPVYAGRDLSCFPLSH